MQNTNTEKIEFKKINTKYIHWLKDVTYIFIKVWRQYCDSFKNKKEFWLSMLNFVQCILILEYNVYRLCSLLKMLLWLWNVEQQ